MFVAGRGVGEVVHLVDHGVERRILVPGKHAAGLHAAVQPSARVAAVVVEHAEDQVDIRILLALGLYPGAKFQQRDLGLYAGLGKALGQGFDQLARLGNEAGRQADEIERPGKIEAGFGERRPRLLGVDARRLRARAAGAAGTAVQLGRRRVSKVHAPGKLIGVHHGHQRAPHLLVLHAFVLAGGVHHDVHVAQRRRPDHLESLGALHPHREKWRDVVDQVNLAGLDLRQPGGLIGDEAQGELADIRRLAPITGVALKNDVLLDPAFLEPERAGSHRVFAEHGVANRFDVFLRHHEPVEIEVVEEGRVALLQLHADLQWAEDFHIGDVRRQHTGFRPVDGGVDGTRPAITDVLGGKRFAIVKLHARAQREFITQSSVLDIDRRCEDRNDISLFVMSEKTFVDVVDKHVVVRGKGFAGVHREHVGRDTGRNIRSRQRIAGRAKCQHARERKRGGCRRRGAAKMLSKRVDCVASRWCNGSSGSRLCAGFRVQGTCSHIDCLLRQFDEISLAG